MGYEKKRAVRNDTAILGSRTVRTGLSLLREGRLSRRRKLLLTAYFLVFLSPDAFLCALFAWVSHHWEPPFYSLVGYSSLKAVRPHPGRPFFHTQPRSTAGLVPRPPAAQPVHGRTDWASKYASRRWRLWSPSWGRAGDCLLANWYSTCEKLLDGVKASRHFCSYSSELRHFNLLF